MYWHLQIHVCFFVNLYVHLYDLCLYVYAYLYIYIGKCIYIYRCLYTRVCIYVYVYVYVSMCICVCVRICIYVCTSIIGFRTRPTGYCLPCPEGLCSYQLVLQQNIVEGPIGVNIAMDLGISLAGAETLCDTVTHVLKNDLRLEE